MLRFNPVIIYWTMFKKLKLVAASVVAFVLFLGNGAALAQVFNDVSSDAWYFEYVETLVNDGIIDDAESFLPDQAVNRAELAEMVVRATDGSDGYQTPESPTFSDVPSDAPYFDYVEAAVQQGIVNGYTDAEGNLTGVFGPEDVVNRATATKILVNAFEIPMDLRGESSFPDVNEADWFHDYVLTAYNQSILSGYDNGYFGSSDPVTRAQMAKLIINAQNPVERQMEIEENSETNASEPAGEAEGGLIVSLNPIQSPDLTVPIASSAHLITVDLTATDSDAQVSELILTRSGVGAATDWFGVYAYVNLIKVTSEYAVNKDTNKVRIPLDLYIPAGETATVLVYGDTNLTAVPMNEHYFSVESAADVTSTAQTVTGDFPVTAHKVSIGSQFTNSLTIVPGSTLTKPERDQHSEVATFKLTAGNSSDVSMNVLILTQGGTLDSSRMTDCSLLASNDVIGKSPGFYQDQVTFVLDPVYVVPEGKTRNFYVECYIDGGKSTDTVQLYLDETYDLLTTNLDYGFNAVPLNGYSQTLAPSTSLKPAQIIIID